MTTDLPVAPDPAFRAHLEWEVVRALRREASLGTRRIEQRRRRVRAVGIVGVCLALGVASNIASAQVQNGARRDSLLEAVRADYDLLMLRRQLAAAEAARAEKQRDMGLVSSAAVAAAQAELQALEARIVRTQLDIQEIQAGSQGPRNDLSAPVVRGRDFVKERIQLDLGEAQRKIVAAEARLAEVDRQVRVGAVPKLTGMETQVDLARARAELATVAERLKLRQEFIDKATPADQLAARLAEVQRQHDLGVAALTVDLMQQRLETVRRQRAVGTVSEVDLMRAELDLKERQLELMHLRLQLTQKTGVPRRDTIH